MTQKKNDIEALELGLQCFGADPARWPEDLRPLLSDVSALDDGARALIDEAKALDAILDAGDDAKALGKSPLGVDALTDRIMATIKAETSQSQSSSVVPFRQRRAPSVSSPSQSRVEWNVAGTLLAASLMLGIFAGASGWVDNAALPMASAFGLNDEQGIDVTDASPDIDGWAGLADELL